MAETHPYALLVELDESNVPRLRNKLVKYFQSKKSSGGDCEVDYENGSRTAVLRFRRELDQQNVLAKESHQINLDDGVLKMTVRSLTGEKTTQEAPLDALTTQSCVGVSSAQSGTDVPTPGVVVKAEAEGGHSETAEEELCSTCAVLGNIAENMSQEFLEMLVENVLKDLDSPSESPSFTLEVIPGTSSVVVAFQSSEENTNFVTKCPQNRTFTKKGLSCQPLEATAQVVVEGLQTFSEDYLRLYFENEGGEVEGFVLNEAEDFAVITFNNHKVVQKITKKKHHIKGKAIRVYPFYESLGTALYGKDKPPLKLPNAIFEPIDGAVWRYLNDNPSAAETVRCELAKHFCIVNFAESPVCLSPISSLLQQKNVKALIKEWRDTVKSTFAQSLTKFKSLKFNPESEIWVEAEENIRQILLSEEVVVVPDKANGVLSVAGLEVDINRLEQSLCEAVNKIVKRVQREKSTVTQEIKVPPSIYHILCQEGLKDKLLNVYPELQMSFRSGSLHLIGLRDEIVTASNIIFDQMFALKRQNVETDKFVLEILRDEQQEELTNALLTPHGINAAFEINAHRVQLLASSDRDLNDAQDYLKRLLISQYIDVEDCNVLQMPEWACLVSQLEDDNNKPCKRIRIQTAGQQVVVSGDKDGVVTVSCELTDFLMQNAIVEEAIVVKPQTKIGYIQKLDISSWMQQADGKVVVSYRKDTICLSGPRVCVMECKTLVEDLLSSLSFQSFKLSIPGVTKFFQDHEAMYVSSLLNKTGCLVQLIDETSAGQEDLAYTLGPKPVYQLQTSDGVEIAVCKADMCSYPVHAIVNASNQRLKHDGGLAKAILNAAGPQLQDECDKQINLCGQLKAGDTVITGAGGALRCKKVIHAVGPYYDLNKSQKSIAQLKRAVRGSLELAEQHGCVSVALPTISRSLGFPLSLCAATLVKAVKDHCDENCDDNTLKRIHFVDNDDNIVKAMEAAVRNVFGSPDVSQQQTLPTQGNISQNTLGQVQTTEGLDITLMKGNIQDATTEVTVNTVFEDLILKTGAVSSAIFGAAGSKLQQLVNAKNTTGKLGEIIITDGCNLKSKKVFHAVTPRWDNGQGTAEKTLSSIFKDCLDKAEESGLTSLSFPAIGTGNLGFPKDLVACLMLDEILEFSKNKQPKHLKKVVIILYSGDIKTIQAFSDEFKTLFPSASVASDAPGPSSSGPFAKIVSGTGMHETKMGSVALQVVTGDITKETTDVIVNSSNDKFSLKSGVSKAILDAAGQTVEDECHSLGSHPNPGMIMTQPGNLKCKKILHIIGQTDPVKISKVVKDALQTCVTNSYTSVSFPAIGTGQGNAQAKLVADAMLDAVIYALNQNTSSTLKTIRIVIFQAPMLKDFQSSMQQRVAIDPKNTAGSWFGSQINKFKTFFTGSASKPKKGGDFVIEPLKVDPACFHICGESQTKVDLAKQWINDLISKEHTSIPILDDTILSFSDADHQRIVDIQKTWCVSIRTESKNGQGSFTVEGLSKEVLTACNEIHKMLKKTREEEDLKKKVELAGTVADWQYQRGSQFQSFDAMTNYKLEQALETNQLTVDVTIHGKNYTVKMPSGPATDNQGQALEIKRIDKLKDEDIPDNWVTMPANKTSHAVAITAGTPEYTEVQNLFRASCAQNIIKIERIQNPLLWKSIQIKKHDMEQRNGHRNNERRLFHGTTHDTVDHINEHGFNRSYAGKNAACYGNGTYFAVNASYSANNTYSKPNQQGEKCMYLCRVLTGDYTLGKQHMVVPPAKNNSSIQKYDSVVDKMTGPSMFVIFHDSQAYPEYLIYFK